MKIVIAHVDWPEGAPNPTVKPEPIYAGTEPNVVIRWYASERVQFFSIEGLTSQQFNPTESGANVICFSTTDFNTDGRQEHSYVVTATNLAGDTKTIDPKIQNGVQPPHTPAT
jgi:hypothetical protein